MKTDGAMKLTENVQFVSMRKCKLGSLMNVTRGASLSGEYYSSAGALKRLTLANFDYSRNCFKEDLGKNNLFYLGKVDPRFVLKSGDIITPLTEQTPGLLGTTAIVPEDGKYIQSQDVALIRPDKSVLDEDFAFYLVSSKTVRNQLGAQSQQTKIRHSSPDKIKDCWVFVPSLSVQKSIGSFLKCLDRKIALNRRKIATLEKMAKEIYDYWFVQYDFPDANGRPYKSSGGEMVYSPELKREIPKGWRVVKLSRMADFLFGYPFDSSRFNSNGDGRRIVRIRNVKDGYSNDFTTEEAPSEYIIRNGDLLIGMDGYFDMNIWVGGDAYLVQRSCRVKAKDSVYQGYVRRFIAPPIKHLEKALLGATVAHLGKTHLDDIDVIVPPKDMRVFLMLNDLDASIVQQGLEVAKLSSLRDFLLPVLMNGQVRVG